MKPISIADIPTAVSGTESRIKYEMGANIAPTAQSAKPNILYGLLTISPPYSYQRYVIKDGKANTKTGKSDTYSRLVLFLNIFILELPPFK